MDTKSSLYKNTVLLAPIITAFAVLDYNKYHLVSPWTPFKIANDLYENLSEIIDKNDFIRHLLLHSSSTIAGQIFLQYLRDKLNDY